MTKLHLIPSYLDNHSKYKFLANQENTRLCGATLFRKEGKDEGF